MNGAWFARHLTNTRENDRVTVVDMRGLAADQVGDAFQEMRAVASGTRCKNYFYHANINPRDDEHLTEAEWALSVDRLEKNLGLEGQARLVVEHEKKGRVHRHVIWSRIDLEQMRAIRMDKNYAIHEQTSRALERVFDLARGQSVLGAERDGPRPPRGPQSWEMFRGQASGVDPRDVTTALTALWRRTDSGPAFVAALEAHGYVLAQGDRRDFCVIDRAGDAHSLARRLDGVKAAEVRARLAAIDRAALPRVAEARAMQKDRMMAQDAIRTATPPPLTPASREAARVTTDQPAPPRSAPTLDQAMTDVAQVMDKGIMVVSSLAGRAVSGLLDAASHFLDLFAGKPAPRKISPAELVTSAEARREHYAQQSAARQRDAALDRIAEQLKKGPQIEQAALGALSYSDLQQIKDRGDDGLRALVRHREAELARYYSFGRQRER